MIVLIVDDDANARATMLHKAALWWPLPEAHAVATAEEARRFVASTRVDIVVVEPAIHDGGQLARDLRQINPAIRFIVHTTLPPEHPSVLELRRLGAERVIHKGKPIDVPIDHERARRLI